MKKNQIIIVLYIFIFTTTICKAQKNNNYISKDKTSHKTYSFSRPALEIDSIFMENLNAMLFDKDDSNRIHYINSIISDSDSKWRHFYIRFERKDSVTDTIVVMLNDTPIENSIGFFENNGFFYWFSGNVPNNIILETKTKRQFSYIQPQIIGFYDPLFWFFIYNRETGEVYQIWR